MKIREMTNADEDFYRLLGPFLSRREIVNELGSPVWDDDGKRWFVAIDRGTVIGLAGLRKNGRGFLLISAYVVPERRGQGIYAALLRARMTAVGDEPVKAVATKEAVPGLESVGFTRSHMRGRYSVMVRE
jgi:GNAT superfamily N-acetyltransferase